MMFLQQNIDQQNKNRMLSSRFLGEASRQLTRRLHYHYHHHYQNGQMVYRRQLAGLPGRIRPPSKTSINQQHHRRRQPQKKYQWNDHWWVDRGPMPEQFYRRHKGTILQPQIAGSEAWAGLAGLTGLNLIVLTMWNPEDGNEDTFNATKKAAMIEWKEWMYQNFTINITNLQQGRFWTLATASISHEDTLHFVGNMFALWLFGFPTYRVIGTRAFYGLYAAGGVACSATHVWHNHFTGRTAPPLSAQERESIMELVRRAQRPKDRGDQGDEEEDDDVPFGYSAQIQQIPPRLRERLMTADRPALGASGSVMAVAAVAAMLFPLDLVQPNPLRAGWVLPVPSAVLLYIISDLVGVTRGGSSVDHAGHLGGLLMGFLYVTTAWYSKAGSFRRILLHSHPATGGKIPLLFRIQQWRRGDNPWKRNI